MDRQEDYLIQIRDKLRKDSIKLWQPPYINDSTSSSEVEKLSVEFSKVLKIPLDVCKEIILELQNNALEHLKCTNRYKESGLATIKIKVLIPNNPPKIVNKEVLLSMSGTDLSDIIYQEINTPRYRLKLISSGKVLNETDSLSSQGVKNGQQILAITILETPSQVRDSEDQIKELENIKMDSRLLALDDDYMQLEDQFGNPIKIPAKEKKALIVAMTLHEKGRTALKRKDYPKALVYYLESDEEFRHCNSQLLKTVDNYALLDLDIAWCYLCLESFTHLPEAFERLKRCEERFHSTYGQNLERLIAVKGAPGNEEALFMRLHLLQAIVLYHKNDRKEALNLLKTVELEINNLKVDENCVTALIELGYSAAEATLGLRVTKGDVNQAANYINENREIRSESRKLAQAKGILQKEREKLGKCADGNQYVDPNFLKILVNMGFNKEAAKIALRNTNNIISDSIQYMQENPLAGPSGTKSMELLSFIEDLIPELEAAGFDSRMAKLALEKHSGDIMKAAEELLANNGIIEGDLSSLIGSESLENIKRKKIEQDQKEEAFKRLREDITIVDDDYLDINLVQEEAFLQRYLSLLSNNN